MASGPAAGSLGNIDRDMDLFSEHILLLELQFLSGVPITNTLVVLSPSGTLAGAEAASLGDSDTDQLFLEVIKFSGGFFKRSKWVLQVQT